MFLQKTQIDKEHVIPSALSAVREALPDVSETLLEQLYGSAGSDHVFMLVDACLRREIVGFFDLDSISPPARCLFDGDAAEISAETAPWLVDLSIPDKDNPDRLTFHRKFFDQHWPAGTSLLIQTDMSFPAVRQHLRRFIQLPVQDDGRIRFFRFWDPRVLHPFLTAIADDAPRIRRMMMTDDGQSLNYVFHDGGADIVFSPDAEKHGKCPGHADAVIFCGFRPYCSRKGA